MGDQRRTGRRCSHRWGYLDRDGKTWNVCSRCGKGELWEGGMLCKTSYPGVELFDDADSFLDALEADDA